LLSKYCLSYYALFLDHIVAFRWKWSRSGHSTDWQLINYGFAPQDPSQLIKLKERDVKERCGIHSIQLYHVVANAVKIKGKNILEVGIGRGGGASYVARYLEPKTLTGVELCSNAVAFSSRINTGVTNLHFVQSNALDVPQQNNNFDVWLSMSNRLTVEATFILPICD
jgi:2-polyprenyl-3-methyl-5-hydroxy-6-metoxy-1,4-benzoquinol methylase